MFDDSEKYRYPKKPIVPNKKNKNINVLKTDQNEVYSVD